MKIEKFSIRKNKIMGKKFVLSIAFHQYTKDKSGVSKVIMSHQKMFNKKDVSYVHLFAVKKLVFGDRITLFSYFGMYIDGEYAGIYSANEILEFIKKNFEEGIELLAVHIHHLMYIRLKDIETIINGLPSVAITVFVHDYYLCCTNYNLMKNNTEFCGGNGLSKENCYDCFSYRLSVNIEKEISIFLNKYEERINFISPSEVTKQIFLRYHPKFEKKIQVLPHQKMVGEYNENLEQISTGKKMKIGYMAMPRVHKGWSVWKKISEIYKSEYQFIVFNSTDEEYEGMKKIKVEFSEKNLNAMVDALRKNEIDAVLMWSMCAETYSYTCFEAYAANAFILTNKISGNITNVVANEKNGKIFSTEEELVDFLKNTDDVRKEINKFRKNGKKGPLELLENDEVVNLTLNLRATDDVIVSKRKTGNRLLLFLLNIFYRYIIYK